MTAVAYRDGVLAADSLVTVGDSLGIHYRKVWVMGTASRRVLCSGAGDPAQIDRARKLGLKALLDPQMTYPNLDELNMIFVYPDGSYHLFTSSGPLGPFAKGEYWAGGSAISYLYGAMDSGADAITAVAGAARRMQFCGGPVCYLKLGSSKIGVHQI